MNRKLKIALMVTTDCLMIGLVLSILVSPLQLILHHFFGQTFFIHVYILMVIGAAIHMAYDWRGYRIHVLSRFVPPEV